MKIKMGQNENGMYWVEARDEDGIISAGTRGCAHDVMCWIFEHFQDKIALEDIELVKEDGYRRLYPTAKYI